MDESKRIVLWTAPRCISTAFERVFLHRKDIRCFHEPVRTRIVHRSANVSRRLNFSHTSSYAQQVCFRSGHSGLLARRCAHPRNGMPAPSSGAVATGVMRAFPWLISKAPAACCWCHVITCFCQISRSKGRSRFPPPRQPLIASHGANIACEVVLAKAHLHACEAGARRRNTVPANTLLITSRSRCAAWRCFLLWARALQQTLRR